ncbi:MAG: ATP-binding protein, partial [Ignavibacteriae bacterium]|nr:ATP-binding protein [Ignavibacteriota bacterium]
IAKWIDKEKIEISLYQPGEEKITNTVNIVLNEDKINYIRNSSFHKEEPSLLEEEFFNSNVIKAIQKLSTPIYLGLDRKLINLPGNSKYVRYNYSRVLSAELRSDPINRSLAEVQDLVFNHYRTILPKQHELNKKFKDEIFMKFFDVIDDKDLIIKSGKIQELTSKKKMIFDAVKELEITGLEKKVEKFFSEIEKSDKELNKLFAANKSDSVDERTSALVAKLVINTAQIKRFDWIVSANEEHQNRISALYEPTNKFKKIISNFFTDGGKELVIDEAGFLKIELPKSKSRNLFELSSGEKQILIMIAHLIFYDLQEEIVSGIFIIDEPELSLHLAWQQIFVDSVIQASPNTQFIVATHSPSIIASEEREKYCLDLTKKK